MKPPRHLTYVMPRARREEITLTCSLAPLVQIYANNSDAIYSELIGYDLLPHTASYYTTTRRTWRNKEHMPWRPGCWHDEPWRRIPSSTSPLHRSRKQKLKEMCINGNRRDQIIRINRKTQRLNKRKPNRAFISSKFRHEELGTRPTSRPRSEKFLSEKKIGGDGREARKP
jgi:hypothetical protein